jgi:hypothetical protein
MISSLSLIQRFWISEAAVSFGKQNQEEQIHYYLTLIVRMLMPYANPKGKKEMQAFRAG